MGPIAQTAIGSGIQFGLNTASGLINQAFAKRNAKIQANYNKELMRYQTDLQQEYIDKQNEYNSPIQQMQRLKEAGLNPNLVYGSVDTGNQSQSAKVQSPAPANFQQSQSPMNQLMQYVDVVNKFAQMQDTINRTKISNAQATMYQNQANLMDVNALVQRWKYDNYLPLYRISMMHKNTALGFQNNWLREKDKYRADWVNHLYWQDSYKHHLLAGQANYYAGRSEFSGKSYAQLMWDLSLNKERQALSNMKSQNNILQLQDEAMRLSNDWNDWYNGYRKQYRRTLYQPSGATGYFQNGLNLFLKGVFDYE